jgi:predicted Zn-dependent protease
VKRAIFLAAILAISGAALYYAQRHRKETTVGPEAMLNALAETQREISRVPAQLTRLSDEEEIRIGDSMVTAYTPRVRSSRPNDVAMANYVSKVGRIVSGYARRKLPYRFHYLPDPNLINAFALPGGHVFIGEGLLRLMQTEDELASVLGHEVEHVDNYHCAERVQIEARLRHIPLGGLVALPIELFQAGYNKEQELEADRDGTYLAVMAGYSPTGALHMFEKFDKLHRQYVLKAESPDEELSKVAIEGIIGYFRSHPLPREREEQVREMMADKRWPARAERPLSVKPEVKQAALNTP